jgi:thermitase
VEENGVATAQFDPNDPGYGAQWHLKGWGTHRGSDLRSAWNLTRGSTSARIVIVDTGMDFNHPDLRGKNPLGYNFASNNTDWSDCNGHGTAVAGTAAAVTNNLSGIAGADMLGQLYVARITPSGDCSGSASFFAMAKAISQSSGWSGTRVINVSFTGYTYSAELDAAVQTARSRNVVVVAAAGNDNISTRAYPASLPGVLGVGATDQNGNRASFSNWGAPNVDVTAPGVNIFTTRTGALGGGYTSMNGTSFASPLVAGIAMLVRTRYPGATEGTIRGWIQEASFNPTCGWNCYTNSYGFGVVNAYWAAF